MPSRANNGTPTPAEQQVEEALGLSRPKDRELPEVPDGDHDQDQVVRSEFLSRRLAESLDESSWRALWRRGGRSPVIRVEGAVLTGKLDLRATELPHLLEFVDCRFEEAPDLRQASLAGLVLSACRFPGLNAANLTTSNEARFTGCRSEGCLELTDAQVGGSLVLDGSQLNNPGKRALDADRLSVQGALLAQGLRTGGEVRIPGARIRGNLTFSGAEVDNEARTALNATGVHIGGSLRCDENVGQRTTFIGTLHLTNAVVLGDLRMRGALVQSRRTPGEPAEDEHDPACALIADRSDVGGNAYLDEGFCAEGTVRALNAQISGDLLLSRAELDMSTLRTPEESKRRPLRALRLDSTSVAGNVEATELHAHGQLRIADLDVGGSLHLTHSTLTSPGTDVLRANRVRVASDLSLRGADVLGSLQLRGVSIGASLNLRGADLREPAWQPDGAQPKPVLDLVDGRIDRDLVCAAGNRPFRAAGQVRLRRAAIRRQVNLRGSELGESEEQLALNAFGLSCQELSLRPAGPPRGPVVLRKAECELFGDNEEMWQAAGGIDLDDFRYENFSESVEITDREEVRRRLDQLRTALREHYQPGPYDQLASVFRDKGVEEHAVTVLAAKQRHRYQAMAAASRLRGFPVRLWSQLQRVTVNYGYRPQRAAGWLVLFAAAGTVWFSFHPQDRLDKDQNPEWDPFLYTVDQLVPIVNLGQDEMWRSAGCSQWITAVLIAVGWILATTVAAGISRTLRRDQRSLDGQ